MSLTLKEALAELNNPANAAKYSTADGLLNLIRQVSVDVPGATVNSVTLLYSGSATDPGIGSEYGIGATDLAEHIGTESKGAVRTVGQTTIS
jgi:hypothetical protein